VLYYQLVTKRSGTGQRTALNGYAVVSSFIDSLSNSFFIIMVCVYTAWLLLDDVLSIILWTRIFKERTMAKRTITKQSTANPKSDSAVVNALKCQFLTDMEMAGMNPVSRKRYLYVIEHLIRHYWCSLAELTEQQVYDYILKHHRQKRMYSLLMKASKIFFTRSNK
jgi:hypothetical protein